MACLTAGIYFPGNANTCADWYYLCLSVNVLNCANASVAYGYAISKNKKDDIAAL